MLLQKVISSLSGVYFYILFQGIYFFRFGEWSNAFLLGHVVVVLVGMVSVFWFLYLQEQLKNKKVTQLKNNVLLLSYILAIPFACLGTLFGGLLGLIGVFVFGLLPFILITGLVFLILSPGVEDKK